ncbi:MAG TPA: four-carbon acid sugar kinase family protein [Pirellulaceae bacterium]|nr:four-carbon acid sugar kinase family protein [Pirellulaceae bacterium]
MSIVILADDLSGAAELAGIAFARGLATEVQRTFEPASPAEVIAVDTDSRHLPAADAAARVAAVARQIAASQPAWIFKKVDSVLRGNVRVEIEAILKATGQQQAVLVPANPSRGRTIARGQYLVDGLPLDQTQFAQDPEYPRRSAQIAHLLGGESAAIAVPDVASLDDVGRCAQEQGDQSLAAGAVDFFAALLDRRVSRPAGSAGSAEFVLPRPALLVCGSRLSWRRRSEECLAAGVSVQTLAADLPSAGSQLAATGRMLLGIGDIQSPLDSRELLSHLAQLTAQVMNRTPLAALLAEGGATAAAIASVLGWQRFAVTAQAPSGVGILQPLTSAPAPLLLIKPGSYAWPEKIWRQFAAR